MFKLNLLETRLRRLKPYLDLRRLFLRPGGIARSALPLTVVFLLIEFFDELHYGIDGALLPAIRSELGLSYAQVGMLLGIPAVLNTLVEPALMLLGDTHLRKRLVIGGALAIFAALLLKGSAGIFAVFLFAQVLAYPASGAFVSLSQATLMDLQPGRENQMMARWSVFGSLGSLAGPLLVAGGFALGLGWRWAFFAIAGLLLALALLAALRPFPVHPAQASNSTSIRELAANLRAALANRSLLRWILLVEVADLMLDIFTGYAALYFADVMGATPAQTSLLVGVLMVAHLLSDLALIPLLERVPGRTIVRLTAAASLVVYPLWLLAPWPPVKIALLPVISFTTTGWYQVLQGEAFASAPGRSGTVLAVSSVAGLVSGALAWLVGLAAAGAGLPFAMWLLLLAPLSLLLFVPRRKSPEPEREA